MNKRVHIQYDRHYSVMNYKDFLEILKDHGCELVENQTVIKGQEVEIEVEINTIQ